MGQSRREGRPQPFRCGQERVQWCGNVQGWQAHAAPASESCILRRPRSASLRIAPPCRPAGFRPRLRPSLPATDSLRRLPEAVTASGGCRSCAGVYPPHPGCDLRLRRPPARQCSPSPRSVGYRRSARLRASGDLRRLRLAAPSAAYAPTFAYLSAPYTHQPASLYSVSPWLYVTSAYCVSLWGEHIWATL